MTDISTLTNTPLEVEINGRKLKVRKLTIESIYGVLEADAKSTHIANAHQMAAGLEGDEKIKFLAECMKNLPTAEALQELVVKQVGSMQGVRKILLEGIKQDQPDMTLEDMEGLVSVDNVDQMSALVEYMCGGLVATKKKKKGGRATNRTPARKKKAKKNPR